MKPSDALQMFARVFRSISRPRKFTVDIFSFNSSLILRLNFSAFMPPKAPVIVTQAALVQLFTAIVQYCCGFDDADVRLHTIGMSTGLRLLDMLYNKEKPFRRETKLLGILQFIAGPVWRSVFGRTADLSESPEEFFITDKQLILNKFISPPPGEDIFNCGGSFAAGLVEGMLKAADFHRSVHADFLADKIEDDWMSTTLVIKKVS